MKNSKKVISLLLIISMIICSTGFSTLAESLHEENTTVDSRIVEQLKEDLGEEKAGSIVSVHEEVEMSKTTFTFGGDNENIDEADNDLVELEKEVEEEEELEEIENDEEKEKVEELESDEEEKEQEEVEAENDEEEKEQEELGEVENEEEVEEEEDLEEIENDEEKENVEEPEEDTDEVENGEAEELEEVENNENVDEDNAEIKNNEEEKEIDSEEEKNDEDINSNENNDENNDAENIEKDEENSADIEDANEVVKDGNEVEINENNEENNKENNKEIVDDVNNDTDIENKTDNEDDINKEIANEIDKTSDEAKPEDNVATESEVVEENIATKSDATEEIDEEEKVEEATPSEISDEINIASLSELLAGVEVVEEVASDSEIEKQLFGRNPNKVYWYLTNNGKTLHLSGIYPSASEYQSGNEYYSYTKIYNQNAIEKIIIDNDINPISCYRYFKNFKYVETIENIQKLNTKDVTNMGEMFAGCENLREINVSKFDTSEVTNMYCMFYKCKRIVELDCSNFNTSKVVEMGGMFLECEKLETLNISGFDMTNADVFNILEYESPSLVNIDLSNTILKYFGFPYTIENINFDGASLSQFGSSMANWFAGCIKIKTIDISALDTKNITSMQMMFAYCESLGTIIFGNINTQELTDMSFMFWNCKSIESLDLSNFDTSKVTSMKGLFSECKSIKSLNLSNFDTPNVADFTNMFLDCYSLKELDISSFSNNSIRSIVQPFYGCVSLLKINLSDSFNYTKELEGHWKNLNNGNVYRYDYTHYNSTIEGAGLFQRIDYYTISYVTFRAFDTLDSYCNYDEELDLFRISPHCVTGSEFLKDNKYGFIGWYENSDYSGEKLYAKEPGKKYLKIRNDITLYAKWEDSVPQYTITFNTNGGSSVTSIKIDKGSKITKPANPTKIGYTFSNWYKDSALTTLWNFSTDTVTKNTTLYAKWTINKYTVTFNTNGGSKIANASVKYNAKVTKPANPTRKGYTFVNWYKDSSCKTAYDFASKVTKNTTVYAKWTPITYKIILKANGQTGSDKTISCKYDTAVTISNSDNHFTSKTHNISSWNTKADGKGTKYAEGASVKNLSATNGAKVYLYAQWTKAKWTVKYNANGGTGTMANQSITVGTSTALTANKYKRTGYTFAGWSKTKTGKVAYKDKVKVNNLVAKNKSITLYAVWTENTYKVTYTVNGGKWKSGYTAPTTRKYTKALTLPKATNITKTGYKFAGWYTDSKFKTKVTSIAAKKGNMTVYAKWTENTYKVTYDLKGGAWATGYTAPTTRKYTKALTLPKATNITKTGYTFAGWYTDSKFKTKVTSIAAKKGNMTVYAKWTINNYTITYELNGGVWKSGYTPTTKVQYNKLLVVSAPTKKGYTFVNWYTDSTFKTAFNPKAKITKNTTLYAKWKKK